MANFITYHCCCLIILVMAALETKLAAQETPPPFSLVLPAGPGSQEGNGVAVDSAGNIYLTGQYQGAATIGGINFTNAGAQDYFLASFASNGTPRWALAAGNTGSDYGTSIAIAPNGDVIVSASISTPVTFHDANITGGGGRDALLARYSPQGTLLWVRAIGGSGNDDAYEVALDSAGNIILAGRIDGVVTIGTSTIGTAGQTRQLLAKFSSSGEPIWARAASTATAATGCGVTIGREDSILLAGQDTISGTRQVMVVRYDADGQELWRNNHPANTSSVATSVQVDAADNVYVCGTFATASITFGNTTLNNPNFALRGFLVKYDPSGSPLWARRAGGRAYRLAVDSTGLVYTCGFFLTASGDFDPVTLTAEGSQDAFITQHTANGELSWVKKAGSTSGDILRSITLDQDGKVFASGEGTPTAFDEPPDSFSGRVVVVGMDAGSAASSPELSLQLSGDQLLLSWSATETGFRIEATGSLSGAFSDASDLLNPVPDQVNVFSMPLPQTNIFFRLIKP